MDSFNKMKNLNASKLISMVKPKYALGPHLTRRCYSVDPAPLSCSKLKINIAKELKPLIPLPKLVFGQAFTDHMLLIPWSATQGKF